MKRSGPIRRVSAKRAARLRDWPATRDAVFRRDGFRCQARIVERCPAALACHHIRRRSQGGKDVPANLLTVCHGPGSCHDWIHANPAEARARGWLEFGGDDPSTAPVGWHDDDSR